MTREEGGKIVAKTRLKFISERRGCLDEVIIEDWGKWDKWEMESNCRVFEAVRDAVKRDEDEELLGYFAGQALQAIIARYPLSHSTHEIALAAWKQAAAMMETRHYFMKEKQP